MGRNFSKDGNLISGNWSVDEDRNCDGNRKKIENEGNKKNINNINRDGERS